MTLLLELRGIEAGYGASQVLFGVDLAIREGDWKLLVWRTGADAELYNITTDPKESNNLAKENAGLVDRLSRQLIAWDKSIPSRPAD